MYVTLYEVCGIMCAVIAVFMLGSRHIRFQLSMYTWQIWLIAGSTAYFAYERNDWHFYVITVALIIQRAMIVPTFLEWIVKRINVSSDPGMIIPAPLTMHLSILLFGLSFFVSQHLPMPAPGSTVTATATASLSHIFKPPPPPPPGGGGGGLLMFLPAARPSVRLSVFSPWKMG